MPKTKAVCTAGTGPCRRSLEQYPKRPYAQFFDGGGSAGRVNVTVADAKSLWDPLRVGDQVCVWGTGPGTQG